MKRKVILWLSILILLCSISAYGESAGSSDTENAKSGTGLADAFLGAFSKFREGANPAPATEEDTTYQDIQRNDKGDHVVKLQERLQALGYYTGRVSGKLDNETMKAMKLFEKKNGLKNDGLPSKEDQIVLYSEGAIGKDPAAAAPTETPQDPMEEIYAQYGELDYEDAFANPENHIGEMVAIQGQVTQVSGSPEEGLRLRITLNDTTNKLYVTIAQNSDYTPSKDDSVTVYGKMSEPITSMNLFGKSITIPACAADYIVLQ